MPRRPAAGLLLAPWLLLAQACGDGTVEVATGPAVGDGYTYRYEVDAVIQRSVDGGPAEERRTASTLLVDQRVVGLDAGGRLRAEVALSRDGGPAQRAEVQLDRAGSLAAIDVLDGVPADELGLSGLDPVLLAEAAAPPGPLRPGQTWRVESGSPSTGVVSGSGRLDRLDAGAGRRTAVASTDLEASLATDVDLSDRPAAVEARQRTRATTAYDLDDGAVRWAEVRTTGAATVTIEPPPGTAGPPAVAELVYEVTVSTRRR